MLPPGLKSAAEVQRHYDQIYFDLVDTGKAHAFIYPWASLGALFIILYLLIDHRKSVFLSALRFPLFGLLCVYQAWCLLTNKARNPAAAFGVGLISAFGTLWVATHMIVNDCQVSYKRIERRTAGTKSSNLFWQVYPSSFTERLDWVVDMFFSFRGVGWSWHTNGLPAAPTWVEASLKGHASIEKVESTSRSKTGIRRMSSRHELLADTVSKAILGYIALDALKTLAMHDPYFWGYTDTQAPSFYPDLVRSSHFLTKFARLILTMVFVYTALATIYKLGPVFFAGILGPRWYGLRGEPWMNPPDMFGDFGNILDKGLAGFWGGWWHQTFRYAFEAPATRILEVTGINKRSQSGKLLSLFIAFFLSGCLHASGSYTQLGDTRPLRQPMMFFLLQGVGIALESAISALLKSQGLRLPPVLQRVINLTFATFWLYHTAPLLADDFAQGGVWLFEPVPVSIFRGIGLGPEAPRWWHWSEIAYWRYGKHWWSTGIAL